MANRREFIQGCIAASAVPAAALQWSPAAARPAGPVFHRTIFDQRFPESVAFAAEAARLGETTRAISGDITRLWYEELQARWREGPVAIAGLTAHGPLFCLERWGWDAGLRVVYRTEHTAANGRLQHSFSAPPEVLAGAKARVTGPDWATHMARLAVTCRHEIRAPAEASFTGQLGALGTPDDEALVSWVIAPITRA